VAERSINGAEAIEAARKAEGKNTKEVTKQESGKIVALNIGKRSDPLHKTIIKREEKSVPLLHDEGVRRRGKPDKKIP